MKFQSLKFTCTNSHVSQCEMLVSYNNMGQTVNLGPAQRKSIGYVFSPLAEKINKISVVNLLWGESEMGFVIGLEIVPDTDSIFLQKLNHGNAIHRKYNFLIHHHSS